ncbi:MAG: hypothetical protein SGARI_004876, partial [Bacillariaceae sp.]
MSTEETSDDTYIPTSPTRGEKRDREEILLTGEEEDSSGGNDHSPDNDDDDDNGDDDNDNPDLVQEGPKSNMSNSALQEKASNYKFVAFDDALQEENIHAEEEDSDENGNCCGDCYNRAWDNYPRCCAIWLRVIFPMFLLMGLTFLGGWALARFEGPDEYAINDEIMQARKVLRTIDWNKTANKLLELPVTCLDNILYAVKVNDTEIIIINSTAEDAIDFAENVTDEIADVITPPLNLDGDTTISIDAIFDFFNALRDKMSECSDTAGLVAQLIR